MSSKTMKVTYVRSVLGRAQDQHHTLRSLGFTRLHQTRELVDTPSVRGMVYKIRHLVTVEGEDEVLGSSINPGKSKHNS
jgi:large subunit ribosomal protein L30